MRAMKRAFLALVAILGPAFFLPVACSAGDGATSSSSSSSSSGTGGIGGGIFECGTCFDTTYTPCEPDGSPGTPIECPEACSPELGCTECVAGATTCVGNEVHDCPDGNIGSLLETCDVANGLFCNEGACKTQCDVAADQPSNVGCQFWAVDLDQQDALGNNPASEPWGVVLSNAGDLTANVTIEFNDTAPEELPNPQVFSQYTIQPGQLEQVILPTRELDCGTAPNDYTSPGTCVSSRAFRISSSNPIVVYQFNVFENTFSNDASLLLPTNALGNVYRVINWSAGHPVPQNLPIIGFFVDRSYVTVVGTAEGTHVRIRPSWRVKGNGPIPATPAGGLIELDIGAFDVINIETDDATWQEAAQPGVADLTGTTVESSHPVAVFSGVESTSSPYHVDIPTYSGWSETCCLDHLEEQMFPLESIGKKFVVTRSPIRSTGSYHEPDVLRFVGAAEVTTVTTSLPAPNDSFTLQPGEIRDTWADTDIVVTSSAPVLIGQLLVSQGYVDGPSIGDPALTVFPPVEQYRSEYVFLTPGSWTQNWVVISAEVGSTVTIDGSAPGGCITGSPVTLDNVDYEARRCPLSEGVHQLSGDAPFGIVAYGYGSAGSYAFAGGADVRQIYEPPPLE